MLRLKVGRAAVPGLPRRAVGQELLDTGPLDLVMVTLHGRERTAAEYGELLTRAGLRMTTVVPTASPVSVVEAVPVTA